MPPLGPTFVQNSIPLLHNPKRIVHDRWSITLLCAAFSLLLAACNGMGAVGPSANAVDDTSVDSVALDSIALEELPAGLGRGYPEAQVANFDHSASGVSPGDTPPNFQMTLNDGRALTLHSLVGRPVVINFWATWCGPCRLEMPELVHQAQTNEDLVILAVNVMEERPPVEAFVDDFQMSMPVVMDTSGELQKAYLVRGMPTSVFIDRDGKISAVWTGLVTAQQLAQLLEKILT